MKEAVPIFIGKTAWLRDDGSRLELTAIGLDPTHESFMGPALQNIDVLKLANHVLLDQRTRGLNPERLKDVTPSNPLMIETNGQKVAIAGTISLGGGFAGDGYVIVSDQTFMRLFPARSSGSPNHILLNIESGEDARVVSERIRKTLSSNSIQVRSFSDAIAQEITYQTTRRPVGLIFGFGVAIGTLVGFVIVYQILSTDVVDHLSEYATFKAMGYGPKFFRRVVLEEAVILAIVGFFPAFLVTIGIYAVMAKATGLPIAMGPERAILVLIGTVLSCSLSGILAMRKLTHADPADLF